MDLAIPDDQYKTAYISLSAEINVMTTEQIIALDVPPFSVAV
ncbi:MAG: hypothetical protein WBX11_07520 [Thiobacillaceae bacterium]